MGSVALPCVSILIPGFMITLLWPWLSWAQPLPAQVELAPAADIDTADPQASAARRGQQLFARVWTADVPGQASEFDGLGPLFTERSCLGCHEGANGGRAHAKDRIAPHNLLVDPRLGFGGHLQDRAVLFDDPEVFIRNGHPHWPEQSRPLATERFARRVAPSLRTVGLILALSDAQVADRADPDDANGDGIRGQVPVGRFGWKGEQVSLDAQILAAFREDLGVERAELGPDHVASIVAYLTHLQPPRRAQAPHYFGDFGCSACHVDNNGLYSDLLLHDIGNGLADPFGAQANLWRTAPLTDLADAFAVGAFLHDGRAASIDEAVRWHGGEAATARQRWLEADDASKKAIEDWLREEL